MGFSLQGTLLCIRDVRAQQAQAPQGARLCSGHDDANAACIVRKRCEKVLRLLKLSAIASAYHGSLERVTLQCASQGAGV
jgi:hypothetical protein